ncbi:MAG: HAMP domain-containing histidine kinase, partial [Bdellovibrionales bacterium]|nr:HAMP domain-containing histidine kinase [Bdellovibrionales bacterium]
MAGSLEEKRREHLEVIAAVAHDIRNPLSSIAMASELLASRSEGKNREMCMIIHRQVNMLDRLVGDLLEGSRIASGQIDLHFATHDLGALIRDCVNLHRSSVSGHEFKLEIQDEPLLCRCDNRLLTQVVNNLISNAVKYSPRGGLVTLKARVENKEIVFEVKDEGIGIEPQDQIDIFKPFHRAKQTKSKYPGVGLGLSTSQAIVEAHEGKLSVKSELGHGTEFTVRISRNNIKKDVPGSPVRLESQNPDSLSEKESSYFN